MNPRLVFLMREAIDREWKDWPLEGEDKALAERYCREVKIVVTGGFTPARIRQFEGLRVPADLYGVGSWLLSNSEESGTNTDFTADVVRVKIERPLLRSGQGGPQGLRQPDAGADITVRIRF